VKRVASLILVLAAVAAAVLAAGASSGVARPQATTINYATSFGNFGRDAYVYVAIDRGYFQQEGFDVKVVPGNGSVDVMKLVAAGRLDYGPVDIGALVVTKANEGLPVKVTSVIHQNSMSSIFTLEESGIDTPKALEGKTVADAPGSTVRVLFPLYAKKAGIDAAKVQFRDAAPPALPALLASHQVDGIGQFSVGLPLVAKAAGGKKIRSFKYSKALPGLLGIGVVASEETIRTKPDEVRRFNRALLKGLRWALDNPGSAGNILKKYNALADPVVAAQELRIMKFFSQTKATRQKGYGLGYIDTGKMAATVSIIRNGFKLQQPIAPADLYTSVAVPAKRAAP
jgi:NitT/TauT family transport system substrate-binding protein